MGRWDDKDTDGFDKYKKPTDEEVEKWQKEFDTDFNYKETKWINHPKGCKCPKHEWAKEQAKSRRDFPIVFRYCPDHFKLWHETKEEMYKGLKWWHKLILKFYFWRKLIIIQELKYAQSDLCIWCRFGTGGRGGKKINPLAPDM